MDNCISVKRGSRFKIACFVSASIQVTGISQTNSHSIAVALTALKWAPGLCYLNILKIY